MFSMVQKDTTGLLKVHISPRLRNLESFEEKEGLEYFQLAPSDPCL